MRNMARVTRFTLFPLVAKLGALLLFLPPCSAGAAVRGAEMVVPCAVSAFDDTLEWLCALKDPAGAPLLRVDEIFPAERPRVATLSAVGPLALRLAADDAAVAAARSMTLRLRCSSAPDATVLTAPNGMRVLLVPDDESGESDRAARLTDVRVPRPRPELVVTRAAAAVGGGDGADERATPRGWTRGRAGMLYRDLLPGRYGGLAVASHIHVPSEGPVPDYVHYHRVAFQLIFCLRGAATLVYEDQGAPFELRAGDCVLQPPTLRHRVLACSGGLEVLELGCPAEHATRADRGLALPNRRGPRKTYGGQRFVRAVSVSAEAAARDEQADADGLVRRDTGVRDATGGLADVRVARPAREGSAAPASLSSHDADFAFRFVLRGKVTLRVTDERRPWWRRGRGSARSIALAQGDSVAIPAGRCFGLVAPSDDLELLEVTLRLGSEDAVAGGSEGGDARPP